MLELYATIFYHELVSIVVFFCIYILQDIAVCNVHYVRKLLYLALHWLKSIFFCCQLKYGADLTIRSPHQETPLHVAAGKAHLDVVKVLVENGSNVNGNKVNPLSSIFVWISQFVFSAE